MLAFLTLIRQHSPDGVISQWKRLMVDYRSLTSNHVLSYTNKALALAVIAIKIFQRTFKSLHYTDFSELVKTLFTESDERKLAISARLIVYTIALIRLFINTPIALRAPFCIALDSGSSMILDRRFSSERNIKSARSEF